MKWHMTREVTMIVCLVAAAVIIRIAFIAYFIGFSAGPQWPGSDESDYLELARSLAFEGTYSLEGEPSVLRPPGYPLFMAIVYRVFGQSYAGVRLMQCLLGGATALLVYLIGKRCFSSHVGILGTAIFACYPYLVRYSGLFLSETLFIFLVAASAYYFLKLKENPTNRRAALAGIFLGLATLTRPLILLMYAFVPLWSLRVFYGERKTIISATAVCLAAMSVPVICWTLRNYCLTSRLIPVCTVGGRTFYASNHRLCVEDERFKGKCVDEVSVELTPERYRLHQIVLNKKISRAMKEVELNSRLQAIGVQFLVENSRLIPRLLYYKFRETWSPVIHSSRKSLDILYLLSYGPLLPLFVIGLITKIRDKNVFILVLLIVLMQVSNLIYWGDLRFRLMIEPFVILFAAFAIMKSFELILQWIRWKSLD